MDANASKAAGTSEVIVEERASIAFVKAFDEWVKADQAFYDAYIVNADPVYRLFTYTAQLGAGRTDLASMMQATFTIMELGDGYATLDPNSQFLSSGGLQWGLRTGTGTDNISFSLVAEMGSKVKSTHVLFQNVRYRITTDDYGNVAFIDSNNTGSPLMTPTAENPIYINPNVTQDVTFTLEGALTEGGVDSTTIRTPGQTLYYGEGTYTGKFNTTNYVGWGDSMEGGKVYAMRIYHNELTDAEIVQNHFADIAKFYRLDLSMLSLLSDAQKAEVYNAFIPFALGGDATRDDVQAAFIAAASVYYEGITILADEDDNAAFINLASLAALNLDPIENLDATQREALAYSLLEAFDVNYSVNPDIVAYYYNEATYQFSFLTFAGYQVRLSSGSALADYAGVRAVFDINTAAIKEYLATIDAGVVTLEAYVMVDDEIVDPLIFSIILESDGELDIATLCNYYTRTNAAGEEITSFNYTVTYKGDDHKKELLEGEFSYAYRIFAGNDESSTTDANFNVNTKTFGSSVNAADLYTYFAGAGYADDAVVKSVLATIAE